MNYTTCQDERFTREIVDLEQEGDHVFLHKHVDDHITKLISGSIRLRAYDFNVLLIDGTFRAPAEILVKKDWIHELIALEDNTKAECIFENQALSSPVL